MRHILRDADQLRYLQNDAETSFCARLRLVGVMTVVFLAFALSGCSAHAGIFDTVWTQSRTAAPKPWLYVEVRDPATVCKQAGARVAMNAAAHACSSWSTGGCVIYLPKDAPRWLVEHEEKHCAGWTHD